MQRPTLRTERRPVPGHFVKLAPRGATCPAIDADHRRGMIRHRPPFVAWEGGVHCDRYGEYPDTEPPVPHGHIADCIRSDATYVYVTNKSPTATSNARATRKRCRVEQLRTPRSIPLM